nr:ribonuclease H-like domain-containing protein [Tanacetum cinerariifolium]
MHKRRNDVKARTTLLLALLDEHQLRLNKYETAKELWEAILKTFGGNEATKKTKKNQLKQQYGNFKAEGSETLEQTFNRLQAIVSHLEFMDIETEQYDLNQKFLTSLAPEWLMYTIVWRNRYDLDTMSLDDVYNHLKVYEPKVQKKSESNSQNMAFISSANTSSGKGEVYTASIPTASTQVSIASADVAATSISHDTMELDGTGATWPMKKRTMLWLSKSLEALSKEITSSVLLLLAFCDYHNMIAILEKSEHNIDFYQIVDFIEAFHIRIETTNEGTKILATVDGKPRTIFESSIRRNLKLNNEEGISPKSTGFNEFSSNIATVVVCLAINRVYNFSKMIFDEIPTLRQYSRRATRIAQFKALSPATDELASLLRDDNQGEAFPTVTSLDAGQDRENIIKTSALPHESTPR